MSAQDVLGPQLRGHFLATADPRVAEGALEAVLTRTRALKPRPAWLVTLQGGSMLGPAGLAGTRRRAVAAGLAVLLLILVLALIMLAGQQRPSVGAGLLAFSRDGDVYVAAPDGSGAVLVAHDDAVHLRVAAWSPDATRVAVEGATSAVYVLDPGTATVRPVSSGAFVGWLPDSRTMVVDDWPVLRVVTIDGVEIRTLPRLTLPAVSPDGRWVAGVLDGVFVVLDVSSGAALEFGQAFGMGIGWSSGWDYPGWSPDSRRIAFTMPAGDVTLLVIGDLDGATTTRHRETLGQTGRPAWSPDGRWVSYVRDGALEIMRPDGTGRRRIVDRIGEVRLITSVFAKAGYRWAPDSASLTFFTVEGRLARVDLASGDVEPIAGLDPGIDGFGWQTIPGDRPAHAIPSAILDPTPGPSDLISTPGPGSPAEPARAWRGLLISGLVADGGPDDGNCKSASVDFASRSTTVLGRTPMDGAICTPWSPDGSSFAVQTSPERVLVGRRDGSTTVIDATGAGLDRFTAADWSSTGRWLLLEGCEPATPAAGTSFGPSAPPGQGATLDPSCQPAWFIADHQGAVARRLPGPPSWSPGDERMAIAMPDGSLHVGAGDGSDLRSIGSFPLPQSWSPDARRFVFLRLGDAWLANADGTDVRNLTAFPIPAATHAAWSPDGSRIAVAQGTSVWVLTVDGAERVQIQTGGRAVTRLLWAPDGRHLAVEAEHEASVQNLLLVAIGVWQPVLLELTSPVAWSPDSGFLLVASDGSLDVVRADGTGRHVVTQEPGDFSQARWEP